MSTPPSGTSDRSDVSEAGQRTVRTTGRGPPEPQLGTKAKAKPFPGQADAEPGNRTHDCTAKLTPCGPTPVCSAHEMDKGPSTLEISR